MALEDLPATGTDNFEVEVRRIFNTWKDEWDTKAAADHTHGEGGVVVSLVANTAALGAGATDGEVKITVDEYANKYTWDADNSKWRIHDGNKYATGSLPAAATYTIPTGTKVFDITVGCWKRWSGSAWAAPDASTTVKGIASFNSNVFDVASGAVTLDSAHWTMDANGILVQPLKPAFLIGRTGTQSDFALGTSREIIFDSEEFDQNGDFDSFAVSGTDDAGAANKVSDNGVLGSVAVGDFVYNTTDGTTTKVNGIGGAPDEVDTVGDIMALGDTFTIHRSTFTAPVTGKYQLNVHLQLGAIDSAAINYFLVIDTSDGAISFAIDPDTDFTADSGGVAYNFSGLFEMDANDTVFIKFRQDGGTRQTDIYTGSYFMGHLVC